MTNSKFKKMAQDNKRLEKKELEEISAAGQTLNSVKITPHMQKNMDIIYRKLSEEPDPYGEGSLGPEIGGDGKLNPMGVDWYYANCEKFNLKK